MLATQDELKPFINNRVENHLQIFLVHLYFKLHLLPGFVQVRGGTHVCYQLLLLLLFTIKITFLSDKSIERK